MSLIPLEDGTIGVYTHDIEPDVQIWANFDPSSHLAASGSSSSCQSEEKGKQKGSSGVGHPSSFYSVASPPAVVYAGRTWLARFLWIEETVRINLARKAALHRARL